MGDDPAPPPPPQAAADAVFGVPAMDYARAILRAEHGGARAWQVRLEIAEAQLAPGGGYHLGGEAWYGGDVNRGVLKVEAEGDEHAVEDAEVQLLYSRAIGLYTDLQLGLRHDLEPGPSRTFLVAGFETLFPYWFEAEGAVFLSDKGHFSARIEGSYDLRLAQRLVLQPRAELNLAAASDAAREVGSGLTDAEVGLRLRYEIRREFAPYVGVVWSRKFGETADFARRHDEDVEETRAVVGLSAWF